MSGNNEYTLKLSETAKVRPGFFRSSVSIVYAGMVSDSIYSIVVTWTFSHNSMAYNLFIPKNQKEIYTPKGRVNVDYVSADEIRFSYSDIN